MTRQPGYYWIKQHARARWEIAEWNDGWLLFGIIEKWADEDLFEINEAKICNP